MPLISVLLPSLREKECIDCIRELELANYGMDYEIIVVSPFDISGPRVVHVYEEKPRGCIYAMNQAYEKAAGEYIVAWSDDAFPEKNCLANMVYFIRNVETPFVAAFRMRNAKGSEIEHHSVYGRRYAFWFCGKKRTFEAVGGFFATCFNNFWADPDLGLRVWKLGGKVQVCPDAWIRVVQNNDAVKEGNLKSTFDKDTETFFNRWHKELGKGPITDWNKINCPIHHSWSGWFRGVLKKIPFLKRVVIYFRGLKSSSQLIVTGV